MASTVISSGGSSWGAFDGGLATYVNGVQVLASQWDFTILFVQTSATASGKQPSEQFGIEVTRNLVGRFVMSPQHAKAFAEILRQNVQTYEAQHGEIPLMIAPEEVVAVPTEEPAPPLKRDVPPDEAVDQVVDTVRSGPNDVPAEPPATSPKEPSNGD